MEEIIISYTWSDNALAEGFCQEMEDKLGLESRMTFAWSYEYSDELYEKILNYLRGERTMTFEDAEGRDVVERLYTRERGDEYLKKFTYTVKPTNDPDDEFDFAITLEVI